MLQRICGNCVYWTTNMKQEPAICKKCGNYGDRKNFIPRDMKCPMCDASMIYNKRDAFLRCPDCGSEFWPFVDGGTTKDCVREEFEQNLPCARTKDIGRGMHHVKSKSSGSKSSSVKKTVSKKKSTTALYKELAANS